MNSLQSDIKTITAFAPATCSNIAVGFDILGFPIDGVGDEVTLTRRDDDKLVIEEINSAESLPYDVEKNTASVVIKALLAQVNLNVGFSLKINKGIPLGSGMGGSAASAVAALVAVNAFLTESLTQQQLAQYALLGEKVASGQQHADNVVPCLYGGFTLIRSIDPIEVINLPVPKLYCALVHPHLRIETGEARQMLSSTVPLRDFVTQTANLASFITALFNDDMQLLKRSSQDVVVEPVRAKLIPGFYQAKQTAIDAGALCASISGSGPSVFALTTTQEQAHTAARNMISCFKDQDLQADSWVSPMSNQAARISISGDIPKL